MQRILIVADMEEHCPATSRGLELAARFGLDADIVAFVYAPLDSLPGGSSAHAQARRQLMEARKAVVQAGIDRYRQPGQKARLKVVWEKHIDRWLVRRCEGGRYAGVVKTRHDSATLVHTSTDWQLLRECPAPVVLVADRKWHRTKPVLAALDLGTRVRSKRALNNQVLVAAKALAQALGVELNIISAIEVPVLLADLDLVDPATYASEMKEGMKPEIRRLAEAHDLPEKLFHLKRGPVHRVIASEAATLRAQIVVMGTVARKGVRARLLGNTAEQVLKHLHTDVLAIKP